MNAARMPFAAHARSRTGWRRPGCTRTRDRPVRPAVGDVRLTVWMPSTSSPCRLVPNTSPCSRRQGCCAGRRTRTCPDGWRRRRPRRPRFEQGSELAVGRTGPPGRAVDRSPPSTPTPTPMRAASSTSASTAIGVPSARTISGFTSTLTIVGVGCRRRRQARRSTAASRLTIDRRLASELAEQRCVARTSIMSSASTARDRAPGGTRRRRSPRRGCRRRRASRSCRTAGRGRARRSARGCPVTIGCHEHA